MKCDAKTIAVARDRDLLKIKVSLLQKENAGLAQASVNMTQCVELLNKNMGIKNMLLDACRGALNYIQCCDEPEMTRDLRNVIRVAEGKEPISKNGQIEDAQDEIEQNQSRQETGNEAPAPNIGTLTEQGGDPVAG